MPVVAGDLLEITEMFLRYELEIGSTNEDDIGERRKEYYQVFYLVIRDIPVMSVKTMYK